MKQYTILLFLLSFIFINEGMVTFYGNKVLRITPKTNEQLQFLENQFEKNRELDFWTEPEVLGRNVDIHVKSQHVSVFREKLNAEGFDYTVWIEDLQKLIDGQNETRPGLGAEWDESYHSYDEVVAYMKELETKYPDIVSLITIGKSYEERDLIAFKITSTKNTNKPAVWFDAGIHAREWITVATVMYMAGQLLEKYGTDASVTDLVDKLEIFVLPIANPDGYAYTWSNNRMWRKTRAPNTGSSCVGTDPNRNWLFRWGGAGSSTDPCSETYRGPSAFSGIEVKTIGEYITANNFKGYINFHSYSQLWMSPWGYTSALPTDYTVQNDVSKKCVDALTAVHGTRYTYGPIATTIYPASGSSADYTYAVSSAIYSYAVELRDTGTYGFVLPANQIVPSGEETFEAVKVWAQAILEAV